jgi:hypothetical protein
LNEEVVVLLGGWEVAKYVIVLGKKLNERCEIVGLRSKK